jgi:hypothetical protein
MQTNKLADTILIQLECVYTLQELEYYITNSDRNAVKIIKKIYDKRPVNYRQVTPLLKRPTVLNMLYMPIAFLCRFNNESLINMGLRFDDKHDIVCYEGNDICELNAKEILTVIRNALSHLADFASDPDIEPNLIFKGETTKFYTQHKSRTVIIQSEKGFIEFLRSIMSCSRKSTQALLSL